MKDELKQTSASQPPIQDLLKSTARRTRTGNREAASEVVQSNFVANPGIRDLFELFHVTVNLYTKTSLITPILAT